MNPRTPVINNDEPTALNAFLDERIYSFNVSATGIDDGMPLHGTFKDNGEVVAAISGHTWGGCCEVLQLWVQEDHRGGGLGTALLRAERAAEIANYPRGHAKLLYVKRLGS